MYHENCEKQASYNQPCLSLSFPQTILESCWIIITNKKDTVNSFQTNVWVVTVTALLLTICVASALIRVLKTCSVRLTQRLDGRRDHLKLVIAMEAPKSAWITTCTSFLFHLWQFCEQWMICLQAKCSHAGNLLRTNELRSSDWIRSVLGEFD